MPIPYLPTDRLYKAAAIGGLALAVAMATLAYQSQASIEESLGARNEELVSLATELRLLNEDVDRALARKDTSAVNGLRERRRDVALRSAALKGKLGTLSRSLDSSKRNVLRFGVLGAIGMVIAIVGIASWWRIEHSKRTPAGPGATV